MKPTFRIGVATPSCPRPRGARPQPPVLPWRCGSSAASAPRVMSHCLVRVRVAVRVTVRVRVRDRVRVRVRIKVRVRVRGSGSGSGLGSKPLPVLRGLREEAVYLLGLGVRAGVGARAGVGFGNRFGQSHTVGTRPVGL